MKHFVRLALIVALSVACFPPAKSSASAAPSNEKWLYGAAGYTRAIELQQQLNVPLVVYFYTDWCGYCRALDNQYLPAAPVQEYLRGAVKVRINPEQGTAERALAKRYGVNGYPSFFVSRSSETRPVKVHPFRQGTNLTPAEFANACRAIAPVSRKVSTGSGHSGKFSERREGLVTKQTTTSGGSKIVTVVPSATPSPRARSKKVQP